MSTDPDPYEQGQRAARENIPAEGNPCQDGSQEHYSLWAAGHEEVAGAAETDESEERAPRREGVWSRETALLSVGN
jgi:hypothetical protein